MSTEALRPPRDRSPGSAHSHHLLTERVPLRPWSESASLPSTRPPAVRLHPRHPTSRGLTSHLNRFPYSIWGWTGCPSPDLLRDPSMCFEPLRVKNRHLPVKSQHSKSKRNGTNRYPGTQEPGEGIVVLGQETQGGRPPPGRRPSLRWYYIEALTHSGLRLPCCRERRS